MNYIIVIIATVLLAFDFAVQKKYQAIEGADLTAGLRFNALNGLFTALIFFVLNGFKADFSLFSLILAFALVLFGVAYSVIGFKILKISGMAIYTIFLMSGGMLLPYFYGVLFLKEELNLFRIIGVIAIFIAIIFSNKAKHSIKATVLIYCVAVFILNGFVAIISKTHQITVNFATVSSTAFIMYSGIAKFLLSSTMLLFCKEKRNLISFSSRNTIIIVMSSAFIGGVSYMLQLIGAKELPATVLYPIVTGGSIIFSALSGKIFFKEKLSFYQLVSIALCFIGTLLFL